jgi:hypothetical protein
MRTTGRAVLRVAGVLVVGAVLTASCAKHQMRGAPSGEAEKLVVDVSVDYNFVKPIQSVRIGGKPADFVLEACTQTLINERKCQNLGYPLKKDGTGELLGPLSRAPVLILTDVASPGTTCVCYPSGCYCR